MTNPHPTHTEPPIGRIVAHSFEPVPDGKEVVVVVVGFEDMACLEEDKPVSEN